MSIRAPTPQSPDRLCRVPPCVDTRETRYWSDTHLGHTRILEYCRRPFASVGAMDAALVAACVEADGEGARIIHAGDLAWWAWRETTAVLPPLAHAREHVALVGNHDVALGWSTDGSIEAQVTVSMPLRAVSDRPLSEWPSVAEPVAPRETNWSAWFARIVGDPAPAEWPRYGLFVDDVLDGAPVTVIVTHAPSAELHGAHVNVHGHLHDNWDRAPHRHAAAYPFLVGSSRHYNASVERVGYRPRTLQWIAEAQRARYGIP